MSREFSSISTNFQVRIYSETDARLLDADVRIYSENLFEYLQLYLERRVARALILIRWQLLSLTSAQKFGIFLQNVWHK